ncbi:hypothetical protein [Corynebacterium glutamicum]|uniref:hypothetical protein n=1 Tax=Corynebacterium glutamicum TaxID=1718 RepID=UPI001182419B|nr:hypothetical protein [Corynebacterium glutamicum]
MDTFKQRDAILRAIQKCEGLRSPTGKVAAELGVKDFQGLREEFRWLEGKGLLEANWAQGDYPLRFSLTPEGRDLLDLNKSTRSIAESSTNSAIMNQQNNYNSGNAVNNMGDHNVTNFHVNDGAIDDFIKALRENGSEDRAQELEDVAKTEGDQSAVLRVIQWVGKNWLTPAALTAVQAVGVAHGLF